jgi:hypothetical protein
VADARTRQWTLRLQYQFDRLLPEKLAQAYELLVPDEVRPVGYAPSHQPKRDQEIMNDEASRHLRARIF